VIDQIDGVGPTRGPQPVRRTSKPAAAGGASFARHLDESSEAGAAHGVSGTGAVTGVLGVQEVDDALAHASKGKLRAQDILDRLEDLRLELLAGTLTKDKLVRLTQMVSSRRPQIKDPRLAAILDEIDLRAQVELAKYSS
jgi:hypothetical protein